MGKNRQKSPEPLGRKPKEKSLETSRKRQSAFSHYADQKTEKMPTPCVVEFVENAANVADSPPTKKTRKGNDNPIPTYSEQKSDPEVTSRRSLERRLEKNPRNRSSSPHRSRKHSSERRSATRSSSGSWLVTVQSKDSDSDKEKTSKVQVEIEKQDSGKSDASSDSRRRSPERESRYDVGRKVPVSGRSRTTSPWRRREYRSESPVGHTARKAEIRTFPAGDESCIVVTKYPETVSVWGQASIECLYGQVEILGTILRQGSPPVDVYSPNSTSLIALVTNLPNGLSKEDQLKDSLDKILKEEEAVKTDIEGHVSRDENSVVLVFKGPIEKQRLDFVSGENSFPSIFYSPGMEKKIEGYKPLGTLPVAVSVGSNAQQVRIKGDMKAFAQKFCSEVETGMNPIACVCGGQNVGKSTLGRYLVNSALNKCTRVAYMECDVGQTEYSPPGCVSLHLLTKPVIGPPFTHQRQPTKMIYFGAVSPSDDPGRYLNSVQQIYSAYQSLDPPCPLLVNTMGWNRDLGLVLLASTLQCISPTYVVQIKSNARNRNFPEITPQFIEDQDLWPTFQFNNPNTSTTHDLVFIESAITNPTAQGRFHAKDHRVMTLLGYLSRFQPSAGPCLPLRALQPQIVPWSHLALHVTHVAVPNAHIMYALNASIVGLCSVPENMIVSSEDESLPKFLSERPVCDCLGFGIVRAIDSVNKTFAIISDIKITESDVNCLIRGTIDVPQFLISSQPEVNGEIPYYGESKDVIGATAIRRRRHLMRRGRQTHTPKVG